jgi:hypothetical protein
MGDSAPDDVARVAGIEIRKELLPHSREDPIRPDQKTALHLPAVSEECGKGRAVLLKADEARTHVDRGRVDCVREQLEKLSAVEADTVVAKFLVGFG